ncbi:TSUP family transporter [Nitrogeniibacter mangrovi]|uniref:Probable membrane transporter protein n=1 Tax=Nitrogeniibacter mangrovi TaxID=2016596 RepID=A0A6C1B1A7_9RHOO|nr:TSUP family transporter [Nitrogeniibacter mangrovi]QID16695.1 TSUP family transporter [Nitrogeniibacter mangrovi]
MPELSLSVVAGLALVAFLGGFISSIAGAGGMLVLPCLLWAGVPPVLALGTNKTQSVFGTLSSAVNYFRQGHLDLAPLRATLAWAFVGAIGGTLLVQSLDKAFLETLLPWILIVLAAYFALSPRISDRDTPARLSARAFAPLVGGGLGVYGGFFGPGMGSFSAAAFAALRGDNMRRATASTKPVVLVTNVTSMILFIAGGHVVWPLVAAMAVAQIVGARLGSNLVIRRGAALVRPVIVVVTVAIAVRLMLR